MKAQLAPSRALSATVSVLFLASFGLQEVVANAAAPPFFREHCDRCHGAEKQLGKFQLDTVPVEPTDAAFGHPWAQALERIISGEMPPEDEPQPTDEERQAAIDWITAGLRSWETHRLAYQERVSFKKLTREEYANTLRDLLGVTYYPTDPGGLPEDPNWRGFERIGSVLTLSPAHIERYIAAGESALKQALPLTEKPAEFKLRWNALATKYGDASVSLPRSNFSEKHRLVIGPGNNWRTGPGGLIQVQIPRTGEYRIRIGCSGLRPAGGDLPHLYFYDAAVDRALIEQDVDAPEDKPIVIEAIVQLTAGQHDFVLRNQLPGPSLYENYTRTGNVDEFTTLKNGRSPYLQKLSDNDFKPKYPLLMLDYVELEAKLDPWPPESQQRLLAAGKRDAAQTKQILSDFAERAFRRPCLPGEVEQLVAVATRAQAAGATFEESIRDALLAVLCAHDFLFLVEGSADEPRTQLNDWELASRLSYFMWSTLPDDELRAAARARRLSDRSTLEIQLERLLNDPRSQRFAHDFTRQWLQLRDVGKFPPDKKLYPEYDDQLQANMIAEPQEFFLRVLEENLSIREFLASDWTMANGRLAQHYGLMGVVDQTLQKVALPPESQRGGILTQAAILSLTSDGSRHRPVHRGKWILESILGATAPPPPPNAGVIPAAAEGEPKRTIRAKLEAHRANAQCASCHAKIDPLGLAFDNYDAIGRWRTVEANPLGTGEAPPVDASGVLPDGRAFAGPAEFKRLLTADLDRFAIALTEKLACYALRRPISITERPAVEAIAAQARQDGYRLRALIIALVRSELFQSR